MEADLRPSSDGERVPSLGTKPFFEKGLASDCFQF